MMNKTIMVSLPCRVLDYCISVDFDDLELYSNLVSLYGEYVKRGIHSKRRILNILVHKSENNSYNIQYDNCSFFTKELLSALKNIFCLNAFYCNNIIALHGAAVSYNSQAYIFLSATTKGKSTLTSFLTSNEFAYITDDCVLIDENTLNVVPFTTPIHLRAGGKEILERSGINLDSHHILMDEIDRYVYIPKNIINMQLPVTRIYFSSFGMENIIEDISHEKLFL